MLMLGMAAKAKPLKLRRGDRARLQALVRKRTAPQRQVERARVVLRAADGASNTSIAAELAMHRNQVLLWRRRYTGEGIAGLSDRSRPGRPSERDARQVQRVISRVCSPPPKHLSRWSVRTLAKDLKMPKTEVHRIMQFCDLQPHRLRTFTFSPDPKFEEKLLDVVGLYMNPPANAVVLCVDEKTGIQALDRTQPMLPLNAGKPRAWTNEYFRHGTRTLLASLEVKSGEVTAWVNRTRKAVDFVSFMDKVVATYPAQRLHVVLDNLNTHCKGPIQDWLRAHPLVSFHYTPTHASWLNLIEAFFSILTRQGLQQAVHRSGRQLTNFLYRFIKEYNQRCGPFVWTKGPDKLKRIIKLTKEFQRKISYSQ